MRKLTADEIECRVSTVSDKGCSLLLYKDARVDMKLLDEEYGAMNWKRSHQLIDGDLFCTIEVWDAEKKQWVGKQDVGTESYTEKEKGRSSDSFKRSGFLWGVGRELYTAPFIWISASDVNLVDKNGKKTTYDHFSVRSIGYDGDRISSLEIVNDKLKRVVWSMGTLQESAPTVEKKSEKKDQKVNRTPVLKPQESDKNKKATAEQVAQIEALCIEEQVPASFITDLYKVNSLKDLKRIQCVAVVNSFDQFKSRYLEDIPFK